MFKEGNLDLGGEKEIKTYAEMSKEEKQEFREQKEKDLEVLKESLVKHGVPVRKTETEITTEKGEVEGVELRIIEEEGELKLAIEQKSGEGIRGLGYDGKIWMRLNQEQTNSNVANKFRHDENTKAFSESSFSGVTFEKVGEGKIKVQIDPDHPAIAMAKFLGNKEIQLRGGYSGWGDENPFKYKEENGKEESGKWECELEWEKEEQCKIMIRDIEEKEGKKVTKRIEVDWDKNYEKGAEQVMKINLREENKEE